ncbi:MAG TPA: protease pro-enzyme activation domain-containing protein, partial [Anaeromyxobacteraceae bacterium]|nr:protease pro-enzyme activation domain-containing protein [Anaeromyxobacteraceae bacterium]
MRNVARCGLAAIVALLPAPPRASAQGEPFAVLPGSVHPLTRAAADAGRLDGATRFESVSLLFRPSPEQQAALEALLRAQRDPASPAYRAWLTPAQYAERFGAAPADLARAAAWLRAHGLSVAGPSRSRTRLLFSGTARQLEAAFRTELHRVVHGGEPHVANATALSVPAALAPVVAGVRNLDDFRPAPRARRRDVPAEAAFTSSVSGNHFLAPGDFAVIYGVSGLWAAGLDGAGETIAVVGQSALDPADVAAFRAAAALPASAPTLLLVPGSGSSAVVSGDVTEAALDVEWSGAVARGARIVFVYTGNDARFNVWDALQYAVDHSLAPVVSTSYGFCEPQLGAANAQLLRQLAQQANAQGQTISAAAGDTGAADCEARGATTATHGLAVDLPASIPEVTGVGGTELAGDVASPATYWAAVSGAGGTSALAYVPERVWNDTAAGAIAAGGGGASAFFAKPAWQAGAGVPADGQRDVPDVSLTASASHDGYLFCVQGSCASGFRSANNGLSVVGGTSAGAPSFAGILAIVDQATGGHRLGNANPQLYALSASAPGAFRRVGAGDNRVPCTAGTPDCPAAAPFVIGYAAGPGYSPAAGLGSVDARALVDAWRGGARAATTTAVSASTATAPAASPITFTATVTPASAGAAPTGTVLFLADGQALGAAAPLAAGQASATASTLAAGAHAISASYSGDARYLPSTSAPTAVTVLPGLTIAGGAASTPPRGGLVFTVTGGTGAGYTWSFLTNASGGTLADGRYTAGPTGDVVDAIRVVDSAGTAGAATVAVTAGVTITPPGATVAPGGTVDLVARGGSGAGFAWSLETNGSGAT